MKMALHIKGAMIKANVTSIVWLVGAADVRGVVVAAVVDAWVVLRIGGQRWH